MIHRWIANRLRRNEMVCPKEGCSSLWPRFDPFSLESLCVLMPVSTGGKSQPGTCTLVQLQNTRVFSVPGTICVRGLKTGMIAGRRGYRLGKHIRSWYWMLCKHITKTNVTSRLRLLARPILVWAQITKPPSLTPALWHYFTPRYSGPLHRHGRKLRGYHGHVNHDRSMSPHLNIQPAKNQFRIPEKQCTNKDIVWGPGKM